MGTEQDGQQVISMPLFFVHSFPAYPRFYCYKSSDEGIVVGNTLANELEPRLVSLIWVKWCISDTKLNVTLPVIVQFFYFKLADNNSNFYVTKA